ncbi:hypothetical protein [Actinomadura madurae]|uniref:hypothetical protein n=1 Tax=Actinomadura madurae TaxID=1993 RepID=UPI0015EF0D85|nr:hypothetical protein [Actinomadura madurae]
MRFRDLGDVADTEQAESQIAEVGHGAGTAAQVCLLAIPKPNGVAWLEFEVLDTPVSPDVRNDLGGRRGRSW